MKNIEPRIFRQRVTIEAKYQIKVSEVIIRKFLRELTAFLGMRPLTKPFIFSPNKTKHPIHHGIAGFVGWAESGGSIYTWDKFNFLTVEIYTCKKFNAKKAADFVSEFFSCKEIVFSEGK
ncbi:hypothetical protein GOV13_03635 [Candidatus Pacearchaeota archaeon]|nr:hypothetical protein [Candidatus Pacearchaeota archaeon]